MQGHGAGARTGARTALVVGISVTMAYEVVVGDSIAGDGSATTVNLGPSVSVDFPGGALFTSCTINTGSYTKVSMLHGAQIKLSGSNCTGSGDARR